MSRQSHEIEHNGKTYLVSASVCGAEPDVGIMSEWSEDHTLHDPETDERLTADEEAMTDDDWEKIAEKFDALIYDRIMSDVGDELEREAERNM